MWSHQTHGSSTVSPSWTASHTSMRSPWVFISAGDASGDAHGAELVEQVRCLAPDAVFRGIIGPHLRAAGVAEVCDSSLWSAIGPIEAAKRIIPLWLRFQVVKRLLKSTPPDAVVAIDFGGFNVRLARFCTNRGIPVLYYFPPRSWAREGRIGLGIARVSTRIATPFAWSAERLQAAGARVEFVGHPVIDRAQASADVATLRQQFGVPQNARVISVFPGSRLPEMRHVFPVILEACHRLQSTHKDLFFLVSRAANLPEELFSRALEPWGLNAQFISGRVYDLMAVAEVGITTSGTVTLEAACMGMPMVIVYTGVWLGRVLWKLFMDLPMVGMPNILLGRIVAPELIADKLTPTALTQEVLRLLDDASARDRMREALMEVRPLLGSGGAARRTAEILLEMIHEARQTGEMNAP